VLLCWNNKNNLYCFFIDITKAKYIVASQATRQAIWLLSLFGSINVPYMKPIVIYNDNQSYIFLSKNPIFHVCTKRSEIHHHLVQEKNETTLLSWCITMYRIWL